jgi:formate-dependent phosphoribosylglycinamide formyltransferase (GAR transformylase)
VQFLGYSAELRAVIGLNITNISKYKNFANEIIKIQEVKTNNSKKMKEEE